MSTIYVIFFFLIMLLLCVDVLAFVLALLGFGRKTMERQRTRGRVKL
jgi:hypothetical protein